MPWWSFSGRGVPGEIVNGGFTNITFAWGLGVTMAVYITAKISGAHLNPAVTVAMAVFRGFPWNKVGPYCLAQITGGFLGAALVYLNYRPPFINLIRIDARIRELPLVEEEARPPFVHIAARIAAIERDTQRLQP